LLKLTADAADGARKIAALVRDVAEQRVAVWRVTLDPENPILHWTFGYTHALLGHRTSRRARGMDGTDALGQPYER
jgi:hypothetical protein